MARSLARFMGKRDVYDGVWQGRTVHLDRVFMGHRFTDEECRVLCDGRELLLKNINYNGSVCDITGGLGVSGSGRVVFCVLHTDFKDSDIQSNSLELAGLNLDVFSDDMDARTSGLLSGNLLREDVKIQKSGVLINKDLPVYVPVLPEIGAFTKDGLKDETSDYQIPVEFLGLVDDPGINSDQDLYDPDSEYDLDDDFDDGWSEEDI